MPKPPSLAKSGPIGFADLDDQLKEFGAHMRQIRQGRGLTLEQLGERLRMDGSALSAYERGKAAPTLPMTILIARGLHVSLDQLCLPLLLTVRRPGPDEGPGRVVSTSPARAWRNADPAKGAEAPAPAAPAEPAARTTNPVTGRPLSEHPLAVRSRENRARRRAARLARGEVLRKGGAGKPGWRGGPPPILSYEERISRYREIMAAIAQEEPLADIGKRLGLTRERIRQIARGGEPKPTHNDWRPGRPRVHNVVTLDDVRAVENGHVGHAEG